LARAGCVCARCDGRQIFWGDVRHSGFIASLIPSTQLAESPF
jgi:hypothetical protein